MSQHSAFPSQSQTPGLGSMVSHKTWLPFFPPWETKLLQLISLNICWHFGLFGYLIYIYFPFQWGCNWIQNYQWKKHRGRAQWLDPINLKKFSQETIDSLCEWTAKASHSPGVDPLSWSATPILLSPSRVKKRRQAKPVQPQRKCILRKQKFGQDRWWWFSLTINSIIMQVTTLMEWSGQAPWRSSASKNQSRECSMVRSAPEFRCCLPGNQQGLRAGQFSSKHVVHGLVSSSASFIPQIWLRKTQWGVFTKLWSPSKWVSRWVFFYQGQVGGGGGMEIDLFVKFLLPIKKKNK